MMYESRSYMPLVWLACIMCCICNTEGVVPGQTPLCDYCKCFNETVTHPDVDCTNVLEINKFIFNDKSYVDDNNQSYNIRSLTLQNENLHDILTTFPKCKIEILDLSNNFIESLGEEIFKNVEGLTELILSFNEIHETSDKLFKGYRVDGMDYPLQSLKVLRWDNNRLHTLHPDTFRHVDRELEELYLDYNPIKVIDSTTVTAINSLLKLKVLSLSYSGIKILPEAFLHTPGFLATLDLSGNAFEEVPKELENVHALETLYLNNNPIVELTEENGFPIVSTITTLHLCNMPNLTKVQKHSISGLINLARLHMSNNGALSYLDPAALVRFDIETQLWPKIEELYIQGNKLAYIDSQFLYKWTDLTRLDIRQNAWTCECENQWLLTELMPIMERIDAASANGVTCAAPIEMQGKSMAHLSDIHSQMRCLDLFGNRPEQDAKMLVGVLIGVLIGVPLVLFLIFAYQRQWFGLFNNSPGAFSRQFYGRTTTEDNMGF